MAETATASAEQPESRPGRRSDGGLAAVGFLGDFVRGPALFTAYRLGPDQGRYPNGPCEYLVDCDDGVGPREVCRFSDEGAEDESPETAAFEPVWRGAWNGDEWCDWIMERARAFIAQSKQS